MRQIDLVMLFAVLKSVFQCFSSQFQIVRSGLGCNFLLCSKSLHDLRSFLLQQLRCHSATIVVYATKVNK